MFRIVTGAVLLLAGLVFVYFGLTEAWVLFIHASVLIAIGVAILVNRSEDSIEEIKSNDKTDITL